MCGPGFIALLTRRGFCVKSLGKSLYCVSISWQYALVGGEGWGILSRPCADHLKAPLSGLLCHVLEKVTYL